MESLSVEIEQPSRADTLNYVFDMLNQLALLLRGCGEVPVAELLEAISASRRPLFAKVN